MATAHYSATATLGRREPGFATIIMKPDYAAIDYPSGLLADHLDEGTPLRVSVKVIDDSQATRASALQKKIFRLSERDFIAAIPPSRDPVPGLHEMLPRTLYMASREVIYDMPLLLSQQVSHAILCVRELDDNLKTMYERENVSFIVVKATDASPSDILMDQCQEAFKFINRARASNGRVMVCGSEGSQLIAQTLVLAYLIQSTRSPLHVVFDFMLRRSPDFLPSFALASVLQQIECATLKTRPEFLAQYVMKLMAGWEVEQETLVTALEEAQLNCALAIDALCRE